MAGGASVGHQYRRIALGLAAIFALLMYTNILAWPLLAKLDAPQTNAWGLTLAIWGIVISLAGFGFTVWQLLRTQEATRAVALAIEKIKHDYASFDVITEVRTAQASAKETLDHVNARRWSEALISYNAARGSLSRIVEIKGGLSAGSLERAEDFRAIALDGYSTIERFKQIQPDVIKVEVLSYNLRKLDDFLIHVEIASRDAIGGKLSTS